MNSVPLYKEQRSRIDTVKQRQIRGKEKMNTETEKDQTNESSENWS